MADYGTDSYRPVPGYIPSPSFTVKGLTEGKRYMFRIRAENMYGLSEPLTGREVSGDVTGGRTVVTSSVEARIISGRAAITSDME